MWILYQLLVALALLLAGPVLLLLRGRHYLPTVAARLGRGEPARVASPLWIHAVSVGEVGVARTLMEALPDSTPLLVTTITPTGQARARAIERDRYQAAYLPFDLGVPIRRFLHRFSPRALVLCEGDYWPLLLRHVRRRKLPVVVINGRVSDRSFARMRSLRPLLGPLLHGVDAFGVQSDTDRRRLVTLGVDPGRVHVTGNLKYEAVKPQRSSALERELTELAGGRPILVAGSTMQGEEEIVLDAFAKADGGDRGLLILAPRHPERWDSVADLMDHRNVSWRRRSDLRTSERQPRIDVVLLDSMGELAGLYGACSAAFVGGTLVPTGGHNPLEPARFGIPIAVGPSMENFRAMAEDFDREQAWVRVADDGALANFWNGIVANEPSLTAHGERAAMLLEQNRGAVERTVKMLDPLLASPVPEPGPA